MADVILTFTQNDPRNTEITLAEGQVLYTVSTEHDKKTDATTTHVYNAERVELATLLWGIGIPDLVTVLGQPQVSMAEWMKKSILPFQEYADLT